MFSFYKSLIINIFNHYHKKKFDIKGFMSDVGLTLIELMVVVVVLGIIAAIAIPSISSVITNSKISATESDLATIQEALQRYDIDHGQYPKNTTQLTEQTYADGSTSGESGTLYGPYLDTTFPMKDAWGHDIWYGPLTDNSSSSTITGYYLYSEGQDALQLNADLAGDTYSNLVGSIIASGGTSDPSTSGYDVQNSKTVPFVYTSQMAQSNYNLYNFGVLYPNGGGTGYTDHSNKWVIS